MTDFVPEFNDASKATMLKSGRWVWEPHEGWLQGRTVFGGLTVAAIANAMTVEVLAGLAAGSAQPILRTIQYSFPAPILPQEAIIEVIVDRRGSSATFVSAVVNQNGQVVGRANAVFGASRDSDVNKSLAAPVLDMTLDEATTFPYIEGVTPEFTRNFDMKWAVSEYPFGQGTEGIVGGYARHKSEAQGVPAILALLDTWPPSVLPMFKEPAAASSVALTMHIVEDVPVVGPDDWFEFKYTTQSAAHGYTTEIGQLSYEGKVIAWVEQLVAVFDKR
ncbi:MAG: thioesterase family protein [Candidatus Nanopelagicales bacterium]